MYSNKHEELYTTYLTFIGLYCSIFFLGVENEVEGAMWFALLIHHLPYLSQRLVQFAVVIGGVR